MSLRRIPSIYGRSTFLFERHIHLYFHDEHFPVQMNTRLNFTVSRCFLPRAICGLPTIEHACDNIAG